MAEEKTALIAGASGLIGSHLLRMLLQCPEYREVIALVRNPLPMQHPKLRQKQMNFGQLSRKQDLQADDVFCCLGTTMKQAGSRDNFLQVDFTYVTELAKTTSAQGASQFLVVSAMGANSRSVFYYNRVKGKMEATVCKLPFRGVHIFRPSLLTGQRPEVRAGEKIGEMLMNTFRFALVGPFRKYRPVAAETVARAMLHTALQNQKGINVYPSDQIAGN